MQTLFTKKDCPKCEWVKENLPKDFSAEIMDVETPEGLAKLAWFSLVSQAEAVLPILVDYEVSGELLPRVKEVVTGAVKIKNQLGV